MIRQTLRKAFLLISVMIHDFRSTMASTPIVFAFDMTTAPYSPSTTD